jgi:hypothetical protein
MIRFDLRASLCILIAASLTLWPGAAQASPSTPLAISFGDETSSPPNYPMFWSGVVAFTFAYNDSIFVAIQSDRSSDKRLLLPVVGPWLALGQRNCSSEPCKNPGLSATLLAIDGASQGVGFALMLASLVVPNRAMEIRMGKARIRMTPVALGAGAEGIAATAPF